MAFVSMPGLKGKVYVPDESGSGSKKHPCKDCFSCQQCSDDRCRVCLSLRQCCCNKQIRTNKGTNNKKVNPGLSKGIGACGRGVLECWSIGVL
jgi:hypothetical protein